MSRINTATDRIQLERKIKTLQATLDANPNDQATAKALAVIHLTHLNDMDAASTAALQSGDPKLIERIKLAGLASAKLTEVQLLDLGDWFRSLAVTATAPSKTKLLSLAHHYNQRFLEQNETKGLSRTKAEITLRSVEASLKRLGVNSSQIAMHLPRHVFKTPTPPVTITPPITTNTDPSPPASTSSFIQPKDGWVELIKFAEPASEDKKHQWTQKGESLVSPKVEFSRQIIPASPAGDYTVRCKLARISPQGGFNLFLPIGNTCVAFGVDKWTGEKVGSSLALIDREGFANGTYVKGSRLTIGKSQVIEATVKWAGQLGTIHVDIDSQPVVRWTGQINRLSTYPAWTITDRTKIGVGTDKATVRLDSIQLRMLSGKAAVSAPSTQPSAESIQPKDGWVELIKLAKPASDHPRNQWTQKGDALVSPNQKYSRQIIPVTPTGEYMVRVKFVRLSKQQGINVFLPIGNSCTTLHVEAGEGARVGTALDQLDGEGLGNETTVLGKRLVTGKSHVIDATVKWTGDTGVIHVDIDGKSVIRWTGLISRLSPFKTWAVTDRSKLGVASHASVQLDSIQLRMLTGKAAVNAPSTQPSAESIQSKDGWVELIKLAKPPTDEKKHQWSRKGESLVSPKVEYSRQTFPAAPAGDYLIRVKFVRHSKQQGIHVFLPIGNTCAAIVFDGRTKESVASGLEMVAGKGLGKTTSIAGKRLVTGQSHLIEATVKLTGQTGTIHADFDGQPIVRWTGNINLLTPYKGWRVTDRSKLSIGSHCTIQIDSFQLNMLSGEASVSKP